MKHFKVKELVSKANYEIHGEKSIQEFDSELLIFLDSFKDFLIDFYDGQKISIIVNDWSWGGNFQWRGLRTPTYYGSIEAFERSRSQHKYGKGVDFDVYVGGIKVDAEYIRDLIIQNRGEEWCKCIRFIEDDVTWVHCDTRPTPNDILLLWSVKTKETTTFMRS